MWNLRIHAIKTPDTPHKLEKKCCKLYASVCLLFCVRSLSLQSHSSTLCCHCHMFFVRWSWIVTVKEQRVIYDIRLILGKCSKYVLKQKKNIIIECIILKRNTKHCVWVEQKRASITHACLLHLIFVCKCNNNNLCLIELTKKKGKKK